MLLGVVAAYAVLLRALHLLNTGHYYLLSPDSYVFHWLAGRVMAGEGPPPDAPDAANIYTLHSGLAYPLAYIAKAVSSVFDMSSADALDLVSKFLPPLLAVIGIVVIYLAAARICNRRVGLFSAIAWALMLHALFIGAAGHVDRDGLTILLMMAAALLFYFSRNWHLNVSNRDVGWLVAGLGVLLIELLLYLEWTFVGPVLLLAVLVAYFVVRFLLGYLGRMETEPSAVRRLTSAISEVNWRTFALIIGGNIVVLLAVAALNPDQISSWWYIVRVVGGGKLGVAELQGLRFWDFYAYHFLLIPMAVGLYLTWKRRDEGSIFFACWFLALLALSLFAARVVIMALPAACGLAGIGLAFLWDWQGWGRFRFQSLNKVGVIALLCLAVLLSANEAYYLGSHTGVAPQEDWQDALAYFSNPDNNVPKDAVIMAWWEPGKWILVLANRDLGQRRPLVDYGVYGYEKEKIRDVAEAFATSEPAVAAGLMEKYSYDGRAVYLIVSTRERDDLASTILSLTEQYRGDDEFPAESLIVRSLNGEFESEGGLEVVHRSVPNSEVVVLGLTQVGPP